MFTILLSILFATNILAAPTPLNNTAPWSSLKNDKSLIRFQSTLLNQTLLTFLDDCYPPKLLTWKEIMPCSNYFDAVRQLNSTTFVVAQPTVEKLLNDSSKDMIFCTKKHTFPTQKYYQVGVENAQNFNNQVSCGFFCIEEKDSAFVPKPICAFLAWMGDQLTRFNNTALPIAPASPANTTLNVVTTAKTAVAGHESVKTIGSEVVAGKPGPSVIQSEANSEAVSASAKKEIAPANTQDAQAPAKNELPKSRAINSPKQGSAEKKDNPVAAVVPPAAAPIPKEETILSPPVKENEEEVMPTYNADPHQEEKPPKDTAANIGKHDSLPIEEQPLDNDSEVDPVEDINPDDDNDDDAGDFEASQQKLPKDPPLANPDEIEGDQKSSQEIVGNNLPNSNHMTDPFLEESGSNFFTYFLIGMFLCIIFYVLYHNKSKVLALLLEGRRSDKGRSGRRKHTAAYRKLDSNLEEAITSSASGRTTQIIY